MTRGGGDAAKCGRSAVVVLRPAWPIENREDLQRQPTSKSTNNCPRAKERDLSANARNGGAEIDHDVRVGDANQVVACAYKGALATRITLRALKVIAAINLHDEPKLRSVKVGDKAPQEGHLAPERNAEPLATQRRKEPSF